MYRSSARKVPADTCNPTALQYSFNIFTLSFLPKVHSYITLSGANEHRRDSPEDDDLQTPRARASCGLDHPQRHDGAARLATCASKHVQRYCRQGLAFGLRKLLKLYAPASKTWATAFKLRSYDPAEASEDNAQLKDSKKTRVELS
ncbi:hypothetical protein QJQ45_004280 [Haematococcus lacustris]|nr:hypothetical protein QJQ45_004280 [Haematococcus lacustris]